MPKGGCAGEEGGQGRGPRATPQGRGLGNTGAPPPLSLPPPPLACGRRGRWPFTPPEAEGASPSARMERDTRGGTQLDAHAARPCAPHCLLPRGS